jgi:hypothetical protein
MTRITIPVEVSPDVAEALAELAARCGNCCAIGDGFATHGASFTPATLLAMIAEDASKIVTDPASWQSANLRHVLASHGYRVGVP